MVTGDKSSADAERYELTLLTVLTSLTVLDANQNVNKVNIINLVIEVSHGNVVQNALRELVADLKTKRAISPTDLSRLTSQWVLPWGESRASC